MMLLFVSYNYAAKSVDYHRANDICVHVQ